MAGPRLFTDGAKPDSQVAATVVVVLTVVVVASVAATLVVVTASPELLLAVAAESSLLSPHAAMAPRARMHNVIRIFIESTPVGAGSTA